MGNSARAECSTCCSRVGWWPQEVAEHGDQHQQQRQKGEEAVVGQQGGEVAALVVAELLHHREGDADPGVLLLKAVNTP
jgi:hypothetical protein